METTDWVTVYPKTENGVGTDLDARRLNIRFQLKAGIQVLE